MNKNLIQNLEDLTQIKYSVFNKLIQASEDCICDYTLQTIEEDDDILSIYIGIGVLYINISDSEITYKFVPNKKLEKKLLRTIETGESPLIQDIESKLNKKILDTYKELL